METVLTEHEEFLKKLNVLKQQLVLLIEDSKVCAVDKYRTNGNHDGLIKKLRKKFKKKDD